MAGLMIGTAGWSIAAPHAEGFPRDGSQLERYAGRLNAVEINSSFYRPHRHETYQRWADSVPAAFRFSVKLPKLITHERRLVDCAGPLDAFLAQAAGLGRKLGVVLVQLPPTLRYTPDVAGLFLTALRQRTDAGLACEPRHPSWFGPETDKLFASLQIARVAADPAPRGCEAGAGGWPGLVYRRLHGAPHVYHSDYAMDHLEGLALRLAADAASGADAWCIFDNTAQGHALGNALTLDAMLPKAGR
jgi:uncharacterized protein YecE (DUF72 family)